jgi:Ankyrin repeats (many copies)
MSKNNKINFIFVIFCMTLSVMPAQDKTFRGLITDRRGHIQLPVGKSIVHRYTDPEDESLVFQLCQCPKSHEAWKNQTCPTAKSYAGQNIDQLVFLEAFKKFSKSIYHEKPVKDDNGINTILSIIDLFDIDNQQNYGKKFYDRLRQSPDTSIEQALKSCAEPQPISFVRQICNSNCMEKTKPLHWAAHWHRHTHIAKVLVENGARIDAVDFYGKLPLDYALESNNDTMINFLINHGGKCSLPRAVHQLMNKRILRRIILTNPLIE